MPQYYEKPLVGSSYEVFNLSLHRRVFIKNETLNLMRQDHSKNGKTFYGLGWFLYSPAPNIIGHSGGQTGCSSQLLIYPEKGVVSVVLANTSRTEVTDFAFDLLKIALKQ